MSSSAHTDSTAHAPLSLEQERMWLLTRIHGSTPALHERGGAWLDGDVGEDALRWAIETIARRHEVLRTTFVEHDGHPVQVVSPKPETSFQEIDLRGGDAGGAEARAIKIAQDEVSRPFDLDQGPLFRVCSVRVGEERRLVVLTMHHLISDGDRSVGLFFHELFVLLRARREGKSADLPARALTYGQYARWQRERVASGVFEEQLAFWKAELQGAPPALEILTDRPRPKVQAFEGGAATRVLDASLALEIRAIAAREGADLSTALLASLFALLHRMSGQDDVLVGTPLPGRDRVETQAMLGYFGNPVVLRGRLEDDPTFRDLIARTHATLRRARANGDVSFKDVVEATAPARDLGRPPLFQVLFAPRESWPGPLTSAAVTLTLTDIELPFAAYEQIVTVQETRAGLVLGVEYATALFDESTITSLLARWEILLRAAALLPDAPVSSLPIMSEEERRRILLEWSGERRAYPRDASIHELFEAHVERAPDAIAATCDGEEITYRELNRRANRVARRLIEIGVRSSVPVATFVERSLDMLAGLLGILKAGGAYVPLDPEQPDDRLSLMLEISKAPVLLARPAGASRLRFEGQLIDLAIAHNAAAGEPESNPASGVVAEGVAYVMFTSGSSGRPKGVAVTHRGVVRLVVGADYVDVRPGDVVMHAANLSFDASTFEIWGALLNGARLVVMAKETLLSQEAFAARVQQEGITTMLLTTALFNQFASAIPEAFRRVRDLMFGGEAADPRWVREMLERGAPERLINLYGPTENATVSTWHLVRAVPPGALSVPIGRPIANSKVYVLDRHLQPVPAGVAGELHVGGDGLARGYIGDPERTAEMFIRDPFSDDADDRLYKTGDQVRYLEGGALEFIGRVDQQVKIRGFRIEPGEVEAVLGEHPDVRRAAVAVREDVPGDKRIVAYFVPEEGRAPPTDALRIFLAQRLPSHMIPAAFVALDAIPLTPNGKVSYRALPAPDAGCYLGGRADAFVAPRSDVEEALAAMWQKLLHLERVGVHDDFFASGGHSLRAAQVTAWIRRRFQVDVSLRQLFGRPTVAGLAEIIREARSTRATAPDIVASARGGVVPLSFAQERLWFLHQLAPESRVYHYPAYFRLHGPLNRAALESSLLEIVRRHESLRTRFSELEGDPVQVITTETQLQVVAVNLHVLPAQEREARVRQRIEAEAQRLFDLRRGPLLRVSLLKLAEEEHILLLNLHHIVTDGWSMNVLYREIGALYEAFSEGKPSPLAPMPIQYADYTLWQQRWMKERVLVEQLAWWKDRLAGAPTVLELPLDRPRPPVQSFSGGVVPFRLDRSVSNALRALAAREGATPIMVLLSAFFVLLYRFSGQEDILVGTPHANRDREETEGLIGFFVNTLVLRGDLGGDPTFLELVARVRDASIEAYDHAELPFERLVAALAPKRDLSRNPVVQVMFAPQVSELGRLRLPGLAVETLPLDLQKSTCDLTWFVWEELEGVAGMLEYSADLFDRGTVERLASHLGTLLKSAVTDPDMKVSALPLLSEDEQWKILWTWNDTHHDYPRSSSIQELFEAQVERDPTAVAVSKDGEEISYVELNRRANRIAHRLMELGVSRDVPVGIFVERSIDMIAGLLGILKAGGAYVPLDPEYPAERLSLMLEDAGVPILMVRPEWAGRLSFHGTSIDFEAPAGDRPLEENPPHKGSSEDLAYVIFTSGSTGRPKGVAVPHRAVVRLVVDTDYIHFTSADHVMHASNLAFDASTFEIWGALLNGARLVILSKAVLLSHDLFAARVRSEQISVMFLSTALFHQMAGSIPGVFAGLEYLVVGGDALDPKASREVLAKGPPKRLVNGYGPTENTTFSTAHRVREVAPGAVSVPIGRPIANSTAYVLDRHAMPMPLGFPGELYVGGDGVARGYLNRPELTAERFIEDPFSRYEGALLYKTGDRARYLPDGTIEFLGRFDHQVKIRGFRIELGEIEAVLRDHPNVREAAVIVRQGAEGDKRIVAYVAPNEGQAPSAIALREHLRSRLPDYMLPAAYVPMSAIPLTPNGKVDHRALPAPDDARPDSERGLILPRSHVEEVLVNIWREVLGIDEVSVEDAFFEIGGHSLLLAQVRARIRERLEQDVDMVTLFRHSSIRPLAAHLSQPPPEARLHSAETVLARAPVIYGAAAPGAAMASGGVAIIGMAGRFPGADDVESLWKLLREGREGISRFTPEQLREGGASSVLTSLPGFVPASGLLKDAASFDAAFFGYNPKDAQLTDPQHRIFLECSWEALEDAGYDADRYPLAIGVFGGCGAPRYWLERVAGLGLVPGTAADHRAMSGNSRDFLATRVAFKLGLRGPALNVQTACSTSLVAVHLACQSLLSRQCDMALAGGAAIFSLAGTGYVFEEGGILSADGRCRPFDIDANGTVPSSGAAVVLLKRLEDALADGDTIRAVIKGSAINNDGSQKVGFTAPSIEGQAEVIAKAHAAAGIKADAIGYVEAHGTATPLGDPIEVAALTRAFRLSTTGTGYCILSSAKSNLGHLDAAAGVTGLIKATCALERELIPATLHFNQSNPGLNLETSPFFVSSLSLPWPRGDAPRLAGVSAFGMGGTNAHVVLEEPPIPPPSASSRPWQLLVLSARSPAALSAANGRLVNHLQGSPEQPLADVAFTLQQGRAAFDHRQAVLSVSGEEAALALKTLDPKRCVSGVATNRKPNLIFMFPGVGTQHPSMGRELYQHERVYREALDQCADLFAAKLRMDIRSLLFPEEERRADAAWRMERPSANMATIFSTEYALLQLLLSWGVTPAAVTGHSLGEYTAACLAGMLFLEDAVTLVALRGQLLDTIRDAAMLIVPLSEAALAARLGSDLSIAAVNGPETCVASGRLAAIESLRVDLELDGIEARRLPITMASHSALVDPVVGRLAEKAASMILRPPRIPTLSNVTGAWITEADACDPAYWGRHLRRTVRFADGLATLLADPSHILVEVGPGRTLATLARMHPAAGPGREILTTMTNRGSSRTDMESLLHTLGRLWCAGISVNWDAFSKDERRRRVPLPTYPFERQTHLLEIATAYDYQPLTLPPPMFRGAAISLPGPTRVPGFPVPERGTAAALSAALSMAKAAPSAGGKKRAPRSAAPVDDVEAALADIWREMLGVDEVRPEDNFFDSGGNSLVGVQLRGAVKVRLQAQVSMHVFIEHPTFAALLSAVRHAGAVAPNGEPPASSSRARADLDHDPSSASTGPPLLPADRGALMVRIREGSAGRAPLFLVQPVGGTVYTYLELARHLRSDQPIYAFRASGTEPGEPIYAEIPVMAARYLAEVLAVQPEGPYLFGGHSGGGTIAYEMARQLAERGPESTLVWMADSGFTSQYQRMNVTDIGQVQSAMNAFRDIAPKTWRAFTTALAEDATLREIVVCNYKALASYAPGRIAAEVVYIRAKERDTVLDKHPEVGWMDLVDGPFTAHNAPGNHLTMIEAPCAATLARIVQQHVDLFLTKGTSMELAT